MKKLFALLLVLALGITPVLAESAWQDGVFTGAAAGMGGDVCVEVTISGGKIESVVVTDHKETAGISDPALETIPAAIVEAQSTDVDSVAGATMSCDGLKNAIDSVLK